MGRREATRSRLLALAVRLLANSAMGVGLALAVGSLVFRWSSPGVLCWTGLSLAAAGLLLGEAQTGLRTGRPPR